MSKNPAHLKKIAIIGTGPAGLMAGSHLIKYTKIPIEITFFEKRKLIGRKLLIAGSSGLNITNSLDPSIFHHKYGKDANRFKEFLKLFSPHDWIEFIEKDLKQETFIGTSGRAFVKEMKASKLLKSWRDSFNSSDHQKIILKMQTEVTDFSIQKNTGLIELHTINETGESEIFLFEDVLFCLGGASYEEEGSELHWPKIFEKNKIKINPFYAENAGYEVKWSEAFLKEAEGKPIKQCHFKTKKGSMMGDLMITRYGLEGTPVYTYGAIGPSTLDLKPELSEKEILNKCLNVKENLSPERRVKKYIPLSEGTLALLFHRTPHAIKKSLDSFIHYLKNFPIDLIQPRPLTEAISSSGGVDFSELDEYLMLKKFKNIYVLGEMIDWSAPTGGYLIQGCVSMGVTAANAILKKGLDKGSAK